MSTLEIALQLTLKAMELNFIQAESFDPSKNVTNAEKIALCYNAIYNEIEKNIYSSDK